MIIKQHLCGYFVAYPEGLGCKIKKDTPKGRDQGSHYSQQKRRIADSVRYIQLQSTPDCRPLIFVATSPGEISNADEPRFISKLVTLLRKGHGMTHFVWVREYTKKGFPHFHFVATIPLKKRAVHTISGQAVPFDAKRLSVTWSGYFGATANNSIRIGSKPKKGQKRTLYLGSSQRKAWYMSKYIGKSRGEDEKQNARRIRAFGIDQITSKNIEPVTFTSQYLTREVAIETWCTKTKKMVSQTYPIPTGERRFVSSTGLTLDAKTVDWNRVPGHKVYTGFLKST